MSDFQAFTAAELEGHRIGITCPGPSYDVLVHDLSSGLAISNVTSFVLTWDKQTCMIATLTLEGNTSVDAEVHHLHTTSDLKRVQEEQTTSIPVPVPVPVLSPVSEATSEPTPSSDVATGIPENEDTEPELPAVQEVQPEQEVQ
jgi:hypothetical protein